ncbi:MAG: hypothetical protein P8172_16725 [Gammaproteobacteria bacterium]
MLERRVFRAALLGAVILVFVLASGIASSAKLQGQNLTQLIAESESIIAGTVKEVYDGIDSNGIPFTQVTIAVRSVAKGRAIEKQDYTFRQFGLLKPRTMENGHKLLAVAPEGFARWREGETVVAFMYKPASRTGLQTTAGMAQGKLTLVNGGLINEFNNSGLFEGVEINESLLSDDQQNMLTTPGAVDAQAFMDLVSRAVTERWIENGEMR